MRRILAMVIVALLTIFLCACGINIGDITTGRTQYKLNEDGKSYTLVKYDEKDTTEVVIPESYRDLPVTKVGIGAFQEQKTITSIVVPEGVTEIGESAFSECDNLVSIALPSTLTDIGDAAFDCCTSLISVDIPKNIHFLNDGLFNGCSALSKVVLPEGLVYIGWETFNACKSLKEIQIPETVTTIKNAFSGSGVLEIRIPDSVVTLDQDAFNACENLQYIYLGSQVTLANNEAGSMHQTSDGSDEIHTEVFAMCGSLEKIEVSENNSNYSAVDGNLFSKDGTRLIRYAPGKKDAVYTVPEGVKEIAQGAFSACTLWETAALERINLTANVEFIAKTVFLGCSGLKEIYFEGTTEQWDQAKVDTTKMSFSFEIEGGPENMPSTGSIQHVDGDFGDYVIYCTDGQIQGNVISEK